MVVEAYVHRRREEDLVVLVAVYGHVRPVDHGLDPRIAVHEHVLRTENGAVGQERKADRPLEAAAKLRFADPDCLGAVFVRDGAPVDRHCGRGAVVVREVPFDAAGDPRAEHADKGRLHHMLTVERLKPRNLVGEVQEMSAVLRQKTDMEPLVLERKVLVRLVHLAVEENILHRIRIYAPLRTLIDAARVEKRRFVVPAWRIGRQHG